MKKQKNKQGIKASKLAKAENKLKKQAEQIITVKNAEGEPDTEAKILIQNKINYTPKVSVIIPVYNVEEYLRECLDSVINQTLKEIEIICVDDGSTDNSLEILKEYAKKDNRISILIQKNSGSGKSRNNGINNSKGEFIAFMDSDDFYPSRHTLENMYTKACKYNVNICGGSLNQLKEGKIITDPKLIEDGYTFVKEGIISYKDYQFDYGYWRFIYKRQFLRENQLYFPDYLRGQDPPFFIKAMAIAQQFYALAEATYVYRVSYKKIQWTKRKVQDVAKGLMDCLNLAETQNYDELYFRLSKRAINPYISNIFKLFIEEEDTKKLLCCMINNLNYHKIYMINPNYQLPDFYQQFLETKKVSIIIPVYNTASYLRECLDSVINQTLKEIEIICVNDGSTDNSLDILKEYAAKDKRIKIINQKNGGLGNARNNGVKEAIAPYIFFVDSDDWLDLTCLEKLFNKIISTKTDMCIYGLQKYDEINDRYIVDKYFDISCYDMRRNDVCDYKEISSVVFRRFGAVMKLYNKNFFMNNKLFFEEKVLFEDVFTHVKAILQAKKISFINENLYFYRVNRIGSIMNISRGEKNIFDIFTAIECVEKFLIDKNIDKFLQKEYISFVDEQIAFHQKRIIDIKLKREFNKKIMEFKEKSHLYHKVSIIIPVYNTAEFLPQCLDSVINQTLKEIEIICVDDGSTDNSLEILKEYAKKDERIIVITQTNQKQGAARNKGLKIAKGEYIQFVDSDDYIVPDACQKLYDKCNRLNLDMINFEGINFDKNKQEQLKGQTIFYISPKEEKEVYSGSDLEKIKEFIPVSACRFFYKKQFLMDNNILFPEKIYFEDNYFVLKAVILVQRYGILREKLYYRRVHKASTTQNWNKHFSDYIKIVLKINELFKHYNNIEDFSRKKIKMYTDSVIRKYNSFTPQDKKKYEKEMHVFMHELGIKENNRLKKELYKQELQTWYQRVTGKYLNLDNPRTFNEKIQWLKLYDSTPIKTRLADKYLVRDWVKEKIGEQYLIPLLGVYDKFEEIDFEKLPNQFVIKCNHGCAYNIIVRDKTKLDLAEVKEKLNKWMSENFAFKAGYELHYRDIKPKIIIEKYMENKGSQNLYDYKFWCFNSEVKYMQFRDDFSANLKMVFYDLNWKKQPFYYDHPLYDKELEKPDNFQDMINIAKKLCQGFAFVCVDMYRLNDGTIYFGEMTFTRSTGAAHWNNEKYNKTLGDMIKLPKMAYNINTGEYYKSPKRSKIKPYLLLPYNLCQKAYWNYKEKKIKKKNIQKQLFNSRIDIKNFGNENNAVEITTSAKVSQPMWFTNEQGQGQVVESNKKIQNITIKAIQDGNLCFDFRGQDKRFERVRFPVWADYKSIKIDGKEILSAPIATWHDKPFRYEMPVKDGQIVKVEVVQQYHQYSKDELKDVILKLNPNSEYIKENIEKLTNKIYKKITVNNTTIKSSPQTTLFAKVKQNVQEKIKLWQDKLSFAHKIAPIMEMMQKNQAQTLQILQEIQTKNVNLENKNNELKKEIEVLKGFFSTQLTDFKKQQEERSKQLLATGDRLSAELQRATAELQSAEQSQTSEIKATLSEFIAQLAVTENKLSTELQRTTAELQSAEQSQASEIKATLSDFIAQLSVTENKLSTELQRATEELQNSGISEISEIKTYCADFAHQLGNTEVKLLNELNTQRETSQLNKNNIMAGINQTEQSLQIQIAKFRELAQEQQTVLDRVQERLEDLSALKEIDFAQKSELSVLSQDIEKQKSQLLEKVQNLQNKAHLQYQELNFADLLHDSTQNSPWLKDKNFALYGGAANYSFIYTLFRILDNIKPMHILEMGLGQTSMVTTQYIKNNKPEADLDIIENDQSWIKIYEPKLAKSQNIKLHQCDIEFFDYEGEQNRKYKELDKIAGDKKYNLIIVDGPFGGAQKLPRSNIVELVEHNLAQDFIIMFDDAERAGEQNTIAQTKAKLTSLGIKFGTQQRNALKSQILIFSKSCEFAKYL